MTPKDLTTFRLDAMDKKFDSFEKKLDEGFEKMYKKLEDADGKYASKLSEKVLYSTIAIILTGVLAKMLHLINL